MQKTQKTMFAKTRLVITAGLITGSAVGLGAGLSACGGGGGSDNGNTSSGSVPLATASDAQREISNFSDIKNLADTTSSGSDNGAGASAPMHASVLHPAAPQRHAKVAITKPAHHKSLRPHDSESCPNGGTESDTSASKSYNFNYFSVTQTVESDTSVFSACEEDSSDSDGSFSYTLNGTVESGDYSSNDGSTSYDYVTFGTGSTPLSEHDVEKSSSGSTVSDVTINLLGTEQDYTSNGVEDLRLVMSVDLATASSPKFSASVLLGTTQAPFKFTNGSSGETIDGTYMYDSSLSGCSGGTLTISTLAPIVSSGDAGPTSGTVKLSSGGGSVTVAFQADGSAMLTFANGSTATLTAAQVNATSTCFGDTP